MFFPIFRFFYFPIFNFPFPISHSPFSIPRFSNILRTSKHEYIQISRHIPFLSVPATKFVPDFWSTTLAQQYFNEKRLKREQTFTVISDKFRRSLGKVFQVNEIKSNHSSYYQFDVGICTHFLGETKL